MLGDHDRVAVVGANGSGKSTLLKAMAGKIELDRGTIEKSRGVRTGYLPQEQITHAGNTVEEEARTALKPVLDLETRFKDVQKKLREKELSTDEAEDLSRVMCELMDEFQLRGGYEIDSKVGRVLNGLGFSDDDMKRPVEEFSGGWQMRIALAKILLQEPQALLLDEPTNHLDIEARNWLEEFLRDYPHSCLIVSHDRYFIDVTVEKMVEVENGGLIEYRGNYSNFLTEKKKRVKLAKIAYEKQQEEIQKIYGFINKYRADKKRAQQVQSRMRKLDKMEKIEPPYEPEPVHFQFPKSPRGPLELVRLEGADKSYGDNRVLEGVDIAFHRGEKVAVVGVNGAGKSTLLKILSGKLRPDNGKRVIGEGTELAYFGQDAGLGLEPDDTVLECIGRNAPLDMHPRLRNLLGAFLFSGEDVDKKVKVLSGGEKSRLSLAKLLLRPSNLLLMDEPTNHLDLAAKEVLMEAFKSYTGALVFVAHDRYFMEELPDRVLEVSDGKATSYPGDYSDYLHAKAREEEEPVGKPTPTPAKKPEPDISDEKKLEKHERIKQRKQEKAKKRKQQKLKKELSALEEEIAGKEDEIKGLEDEMAKPGVGADYMKLIDVTKERDGKKKELDRLYARWEELEHECQEMGEE